jgi:hypothetical protein
MVAMRKERLLALTTFAIQFEIAFDTFRKIVTAYSWSIARKSGPAVFPMSC